MQDNFCIQTIPGVDSSLLSWMLSIKHDDLSFVTSPGLKMIMRCVHLQLRIFSHVKNTDDTYYESFLTSVKENF